LKDWIGQLVKALSAEDLRSIQIERQDLIEDIARIDRRIDRISSASNIGPICASELGSRARGKFDDTYVNADYIAKATGNRVGAADWLADKPKVKS